MVHPSMTPLLQRAAERPAVDFRTVDPVTRRRRYHDMAVADLGVLAPVARREDLQLPLPGRDVPARLYVPLRDDHRALIVYVHGGSFVEGDLDTHEGVCRRVAADLAIPVLALDYRLAPEYPFPAGLDDVVDSLRYVASHQSTLALDDVSLILMGDSAGATLATVAATLTRDENLGVCAQVLIYPTLGPDVVTDSAHAYATGYLLEMDQLRHDYASYLGDFGDHTDPRVSPLMSTDLARVPPAVILVAGCDPLRDEGVAYAGLLEDFGVDVELLEADGMLHGFFRLGGVVPDALAIVDDLARHVQHFVERAGNER